jgi:flagellar biogenesis protein FliO
MKMSTKVMIGFAGMFTIIGFIYLCKYIWRKFLDYQSNKDRTYNVFDKAEFSAMETKNMKAWNFTIP